ncbi:MAG: orotidine-5'-phosphate decarboxylase [Deltaproteobacteria bacterium]|nr:orotidine-5'-phosphate decarboxylase [Deltaproteobacteria bacterium]
MTESQNHNEPIRLSPLAVALDTSDWETFRQWCSLFGPRVGVLKVGLEAYLRWGPDAVREAQKYGAEIFLDLKLHDIPNTVAGAVGAARRLGVRYLTVHAGGGAAMLGAAVEAAGAESDENPVALLAVTVLTHLDQPQLEQLDLPGLASERVLRWATLAHGAGCAGIVCSALEVAELRTELPPPFLIVTPGIRLDSVAGEDQKRVATPRAALAGGSDLLVVGRPLTRAEKPLEALAAFGAEIRK